MAKSVQDLFIRLGVEGIQGVNALKSSLNALGKSIGPTDQNIRKIRNEILEFANAGQRSTQAIKGVVESFKGLQAQASIGSSVYRQLAADVESLEGELKSLTPEAQKAAKAISAFGASKVPDAFVEDMKQRRRELQGIAVDSDRYLEKLVAIKNFEAQQAARVGRQEVSAAARVARTGIYSKIVQSDQPATLAALRLRIGEVQNEVENLDFTTEEYADANKELIALQQSLSQALGDTSSSFDRLGDAQARAARRAEKLAGIQAAAKPGTIGTRDPRTGAMIAGGSARALPPLPTREISGLYQGIGNIGMSGIQADIDRMGKSVKEVTVDINAATRASNGSINSLQAQRTALTQLRAGLDPTSQDFRELGREIDRVDKRLGKLSQRRKFSLKGAAQTTGAVASAGIFGGPAGFAGALLGAPFGPGGAVVGGSVGATVGVAAETIQSFTDYAASITLAEKAMKRIIATGKHQENGAKNIAIANQTIEFAVKKLNVEREDATIGMTKLGAAVLGAGGNMEAAALAFLGTTTAIKATKGSAEDVRGGLTALVQMFSKGKISAEELSGQLGERFPAAVTAFAEANNISTMALQKQLKNGEVGLDKLIKFLQFAVKEYSKGALDMAASSEESGMRQKVAFKEVQNELGKQLVQVGSDLQEGITQALSDLTPTIVRVATVVAEVIKGILDGIAFLVKNIKAISRLIVALAGTAVLGLLIKTLGLATAAVAKKGLAGGLLLTSKVIATRTIPAIGALIGKLRALLVFMAKNPILLAVMGITALGVTGYNMNKRFDDLVDSIKDGTRSLKEGAEMADKYNDRLTALREVRGLVRGDKGAEAALRAGERGLAGGGSIGFGAPQMVVQKMKNIEAKFGDELRPLGVISDLASLNQAIIDEQQKVNILNNTLDAQAREIASDGFTMPDLGGAFAPGLGDPDDPDGSGKSARNRLAKINRAGELLGIERQILKNAREIAFAQAKADRSRVHQLNNQKIQLEFQKDSKQVEHQYLDAVREANHEENETTKIQKLQEALTDRNLANKDLLMRKEEALTTEKQRNLLAEERITKQIEKQMFNLRDQLGLVSPQEKIENFRQGLIDQYGSNDARIPGMVDQQRQLLNPTTFEKIQQAVRGLNKELQELTNPANMIINSANQIGTAFTDSFRSIIDGSATTQEALASFFKNIGNFFLDMAAQIIQKMITMYILNTVVGLLPGLRGGGGGAKGILGQGTLDSVTRYSGITGSTRFAKGAAFAKNKIIPYAKGGIVNKPTMFAYADGGAGRFGLMGEQGAEAILPLRRGPNGKLGVESSGSVGNVTVNVDASGSSVEGDSAQASQLGKMLGAAVRAELIKQKRPGGVLAG